MTPESVIGKGRAKQKAEDTLASRLSRVAYASPRKAPSKDRTSRFWFRMDHKELEVTKEMMRPKEVEHIDSQVVKRLSRYRKSSPADFQKYIVRVSSFSRRLRLVQSRLPVVLRRPLKSLPVC